MPCRNCNLELDKEFYIAELINANKLKAPVFFKFVCPLCGADNERAMLDKALVKEDVYRVLTACLNPRIYIVTKCCFQVTTKDEYIQQLSDAFTRSPPADLCTLTCPLCKKHTFKIKDLGELVGPECAADFDMRILKCPICHGPLGVADLVECKAKHVKCHKGCHEMCEEKECVRAAKKGKVCVECQKETKEPKIVLECGDVYCRDCCEKRGYLSGERAYRYDGKVKFSCDGCSYSYKNIGKLVYDQRGIVKIRLACCDSLRDVDEELGYIQQFLRAHESTGEFDEISCRHRKAKMKEEDLNLLLGKVKVNEIKGWLKQQSKSLCDKCHSYSVTYLELECGHKFCKGCYNQMFRDKAKALTDHHEIAVNCPHCHGQKKLGKRNPAKHALRSE